MREPRRRNSGIRKRCGCPRKKWPGCPHPWHFNYKPRGGPHYRLSLDRELGRHIDSKTEAEREAAKIRVRIDAAAFRPSESTTVTPQPGLTFRAYADIWQARRGNALVSAPLDVYRLKTISAFELPGTGRTFGETPLDAVTADDIEAFREARKGSGLSAVSINHDLRLLRKMFNWAVRKRFLTHSPWKVGTEPAIALEREIPRHKRFPTPDVEVKLLAAATPLLRAIITAMLDTACRPGELLSLQWRDVSLERRELTIQAEKEKTRRERIIPMSSRLSALLEMRRDEAAKLALGPEAYVFGDEIGRRVRSVREAWVKAASAAGLRDFQLRDLRHEAASRFDEAGVPIVYVSTMLGHSNLSTTSRYLNINRRGLHMAMRQFELARASATESGPSATAQSVAHALHTGESSAVAVVHDAPANKPSKASVQ